MLPVGAEDRVDDRTKLRCHFFFNHDLLTTRFGITSVTYPILFPSALRKAGAAFLNRTRFSPDPRGPGPRPPRQPLDVPATADKRPSVAIHLSREPLAPPPADIISERSDRNAPLIFLCAER
jgi:hypothetical protein